MYGQQLNELFQYNYLWMAKMIKMIIHQNTGTAVHVLGLLSKLTHVGLPQVISL